MKTLLKNIENIAQHAERMAAKEVYTEEVLTLTKACVQLTGCYQVWKELEIHEKFHFVKNTLPGEDPLGKDLM